MKKIFVGIFATMLSANCIAGDNIGQIARILKAKANELPGACSLKLVEENTSLKMSIQQGNQAAEFLLTYAWAIPVELAHGEMGLGFEFSQNLDSWPLGRKVNITRKFLLAVDTDGKVRELTVMEYQGRGKYRTGNAISCK